MGKLDGLIVKMSVVLEKTGTMDVPICVGRSVCIWIHISQNLH